jgi:hypothetical protein
LGSDAVAADNVRHCVIDFPDDVPVLLVDGDPGARDARFLSAALAPGRAARTGITPRIETAGWLSRNPLQQFQAIYLANVDWLESSAVKALERYVSEGGGLGIFLGPRSTAEFTNDQLYQKGKGLFPLPLAGPAELLVDRLHQAPDVEVTEHPLLKLFAGQRNNLISYVTVERYFAAPENWKPAADSGVKIVARLRNGAPLIVERPFGKGRVVAVMTTAAPDWNNWATGESFVIVAHKLQIHLGPAPASGQLVGAPLAIEVDAAQYRPQVRLATPRQAGPLTVDAARPADGKLSVTITDTDAAGVYEAGLFRSDGSREVRRYAVNVDPAEGDLRTISAQQLADRLEGVRYQYEQAGLFRYAANQLAGIDLSGSLLYLLVALLIIEQILAWSASYHPSKRHQLQHRGGASR